MNCAGIMTNAPPTIRDDASVAEAAGALVAQREMDLPVLDGDGRYAGMFGISDLLGLLVPRVALAGDLTANLRFIGDDPEELRRRPGIDVIRAQIRGDLPLPPMHHLMGLVPTDATEGAAACALPRWLRGVPRPQRWPAGLRRKVPPRCRR